MKYTRETGISYNEICSDFQPWPVFNRRKPRIHGESNKSETEGAWKRLTLSYAGRTFVAVVPYRVEREMKRNEGRALPPNCVEDPRWISRLAGNVNQNVSSICMRGLWKLEAVLCFEKWTVEGRGTNDKFKNCVTHFREPVSKGSCPRVNSFRGDLFTVSFGKKGIFPFKLLFLFLGGGRWCDKLKYWFCDVINWNIETLYCYIEIFIFL